MAFTGVLGTSDSFLGNIVLGITGSSGTDVSASDSLTFSESFVGFIDSVLVSDTITFTDTYVSHLNDELQNDTLTFTETFFSNLSASYTRSDTLVFTEAFTLTFTLSLPLDDTVTFVDDYSGFAAKGQYDTLTFVESFDVNRSGGAIKSDTLIFAESFIVDKFLGLHFDDDILSFDEAFSHTRVQYATTIDSLTFSEHLISGATPYENVNEAIVFVETRTKIRVRHAIATDTLLFTEQLTRQGTLNLTVTDTLVFQEGHHRPVNIGLITDVFVPGYQVVKIGRKCAIILRGPDLTIVLPCPEFNDQESSLSTIKVLRSMTGAKRIYKQSTNKYKLHYDFVINRLKAWELRNFIENYNNKPFNLTNHKGEIWQVVFSTNPFSFTEAAHWEGSCGNKFTIPLEFEGVRLN